MDSSILKVPIETQRIALKSVQLHIEKELVALVQRLETGLDAEARIATLERLKALKTKLQKITESFTEAENSYTRRTEYLEVNPPLEDKLLLYIGDYFLRSNYAGSASALADHYSLHNLLDTSLMQECWRIVKSIRAHDASPVLQWCINSRVSLRKAGNPLEYNVRHQQFYELAQTDPFKAITYSRKYLGKHLDAHYASLSSATLFLVKAGTSPGWDKLEQCFIAAFLEIHGKSPQIELLDLVSSGLAVLRTHNCSPTRPRLSRHRNQSLKDHMCPACSSDLGVLAQSVPYAHHTKSHLDSEMVILPNGRCYGANTLRELRDQAGIEGLSIYDPVTQEVFDEADLRKIYPQ